MMMTRLMIILAVTTLISKKQDKKEIYVGTSFLSEVYYDPDKKYDVVEIGMTKFGLLDYLDSAEDAIGVSKNGKLYMKNGNLFYQNKNLKIDTKLKKKKYSKEIDYKRSKIFSIDAFNRASLIKDSLQVEEYEFDWDTEEDYCTYRDNSEINFKRYMYTYLKPLYRKIKK